MKKWIADSFKYLKNRTGKRVDEELMEIFHDESFN